MKGHKLSTDIDTCQFFEYIFENSNKVAVVIFDLEGIVLDINAPVTRSFGYTKEEIIGKNISILFIEDDLKRNLHKIELTTVKQKGFSEDDNYVRHRDGSHIWVTAESTLVKEKAGRTYIVKLMRDINEQKLLEKYLMEAKDFNESVIQSVNEPLIALNEDLVIEKANRAFYKTFNIEEPSIEQLSFTKIIDRLFNESFLIEILNKVSKESAEYTNVELPANLPELGERVFNISAHPIAQDNKQTNKVLLAISDITDRKMLDKRKDDFLSYTSHELRTPITSIKAYLQLMDACIKENKGCDIPAYLKKAQDFVERLNNLISDLHDLTKASSGKLQLKKSTFNFEFFLQDVIETSQIAHPSHKITKQGEANIKVNADRYRLQQVLGNYLSNAIKYSPKATDVFVQVKIENGQVIVGVTDYGLGIPKDKINKLFHKFYRAEHTQKIEGLGLGLFISREIIKSHNGKVWVESEEGKGSTFYFSIPIQ